MLYVLHYTSLPDQMHRALIESCYEDEVVGHISRDSTAIQARERPAAKEPAPAKRKPGRARKGGNLQGSNGVSYASWV